MKIGFQTILWWPFLMPIKQMLKVIANAGYEGIEFKQRPDELPNIEQLLELTSELGLEVLGFSGGSIKERMAYCGSFRPQYLYVEEWNEAVSDLARRKGFTLGLHLHVFKPTHRLEKAQEYLHIDENLTFLPDTAHLTIAGYDPKQAICKWKDRVSAVHLKDWTPDFGRSVHRYAQGFVELGEGIVDLGGVLDTLRDINYEGWIVVEQDTTRTSPMRSTFECAQWLSEKGLMPNFSPNWSEIHRPISVPFSSQYDNMHLAYKERPKLVTFMEEALATGWQNLQASYESIAESFLKLLNAELVTVWVCSSARSLINLVSISPRLSDIGPLQSYIDYTQDLSRYTIEEQKIKNFDLTDPEFARHFVWPDLLKERNWKRMLSLPIFLPWNPNHVRMIVNILHNNSSFDIEDSNLLRQAIAVGYATSFSLDQATQRLAAKISALVNNCDSVAKLGAELTETIRSELDCENVTVFIRSSRKGSLRIEARNC